MTIGIVDIVMQLMYYAQVPPPHDDDRTLPDIIPTENVFLPLRPLHFQ